MNTFISESWIWGLIVNNIMELCHHLPNRALDEQTYKAMSELIISDKYLSGGMGDGGGCHQKSYCNMEEEDNYLT